MIRRKRVYEHDVYKTDINKINNIFEEVYGDIHRLKKECGNLQSIITDIDFKNSSIDYGYDRDTSIEYIKTWLRAISDNIKKLEHE